MGMKREGMGRTARAALRRALLALCLLPLSAGCGQAEEEAYQVPKPDAEYLRKTGAPGYARPTGSHSECLGRLVFDAPAPVQWPEFLSGTHSDPPYYGIPKLSHSFRNAWGGARIKIGEIEVGVHKIGVDASRRYGDPLTLEGQVAWEEPQILTREQLLAAIKWQEDRIQEHWERMKTEPPEERKSTRNWIKHSQSELEEEHALLAESKGWGRIPSGIPGAVVLWRGSKSRDWRELLPETLTPREQTFTAYIERNGYLYAFRTTQRKEPAALRKEFLDFLSRWRPRAEGEIPAGIGLCIPHGFIADDGATPYRIEMALRHPDAPGVLYKIMTATVDPRLGPETTVLTATARALAGSVSGHEKELADRYVQKKVGPRIARIGGLTAQQGGFAAQKPDTAGQPVNIYSVYTGYGGWQDTHALPSVIVELDTVTRAEAPELPSDPPPFEQSMERLEALLAGMRLRPTEPPMPELRGLAGK